MMSSSRSIPYNVSELFSLPIDELRKRSVAELLFYVWESYNRKKIKDKNTITADPLNDQTINFFAAIPAAQTSQFNTSTKRILQLGISLGNYYLKKKLQARDIVGYDYSPAAIDYVNAHRMKGRLTDLDSIDPESKKLAYVDLLEADLSVAAEILIIRTFECLKPEVVMLLIFNIIEFSKAGTKIYIENSHPEKDAGAAVITHRDIPLNYIPSFFAPRTDFEFQLCKVTYNEPSDTATPDEKSSVERFIVKKR
jgi:hypothetical protein